MVTAGTVIIPAGEGCAFDVEETVPEGTTFTVTEFGDGSWVVTHGNSEPTLTNLETGTTFLQKTRGQITDRFDPQTNKLRFTTSGRIFISFLPGDQGPFGEVDEPGLLLSIIGHQVATLDLDANVITSYSLRGQATDICAASPTEARGCPSSRVRAAPTMGIAKATGRRDSRLGSAV